MELDEIVDALQTAGMINIDVEDIKKKLDIKQCADSLHYLLCNALDHETICLYHKPGASVDKQLWQTKAEDLCIAFEVEPKKLLELLNDVAAAIGRSMARNYIKLLSNISTQIVERAPRYLTAASGTCDATVLPSEEGFDLPSRFQDHDL